jgi:hypothetical protein
MTLSKGKIEVLQRLAAVLGDGRDWSHDGTVIDHGPGATTKFNAPRCSCSHPVRYQYVLNHKDNAAVTAFVGSECIEYFELANPELFATLKASATKFEAKQKEAKAAERAAKVAAERDEMIAKVKAFLAAFKAVCESRKFITAKGYPWIPPELFNAQREIDRLNPYTAMDMTRKMTDRVRINKLKRVLDSAARIHPDSARRAGL